MPLPPPLIAAEHFSAVTSHAPFCLIPSQCCRSHPIFQFLARIRCPNFNRDNKHSWHAYIDFPKSLRAWIRSPGAAAPPVRHVAASVIHPNVNTPLPVPQLCCDEPAQATAEIGLARSQTAAAWAVEPRVDVFDCDDGVHFPFRSRP